MAFDIDLWEGSFGITIVINLWSLCPLREAVNIHRCFCPPQKRPYIASTKRQIDIITTSFQLFDDVKTYVQRRSNVCSGWVDNKMTS